MISGKGFAQPDKAGSFGDELITLYKITHNPTYLDAAVKIANTLARHTQKGDNDHSPLPFKVNVFSGETGKLKSNVEHGEDVGLSSYTTNWVGTLQLFEKLVALDMGEVFKSLMSKPPIKHRETAMLRGKRLRNCSSPH